jgi:hypothetical protein
VYYRFSNDNIHKSADYDPALDLIITMDFNVSPGTANLLQEGQHYLGPGTIIFDEIWIERGSTTDRICQMLLKHPVVKNHKGRILLYGDATGNNAGTGKVLGSDWEIILSVFKPIYGDKVQLCVGKSNPLERERVNAVNARLKTYSNNIRCVVNPRCVHTITDFRGVLSDDQGRIEKKRDPKLTHLTDGIGYYIASMFPIRVGGAVAAKSLYG